jgi:hypothetical protein
LINPNLMSLKNLLKAQKPMVSGNVPRLSLNVPGPSLNGLNLREEPSLYRFSFEKISVPIEST